MKDTVSIHSFNRVVEENRRLREDIRLLADEDVLIGDRDKVLKKWRRIFRLRKKMNKRDTPKYGE